MAGSNLQSIPQTWHFVAIKGYKKFKSQQSEWENRMQLCSTNFEILNVSFVFDIEIRKVVHVLLDPLVEGLVLFHAELRFPAATFAFAVDGVTST